ncbi:MAG: D-TA family PLP-dependent enzyme [Nocardioidaceae bacterium]|nr:D-TA family PLP-dependent enzyme [Nocardioidaceae bacterium]NUS52787.1 D-TA family PLP-dependent enzyme [Nocardioidaceae bacterium]
MRATPYLQVDLDVLEANVAAMAKHAAAHGLAVRPHAKTHKTLEVARLQLAAGATGLTVATVAEAEVYAAAGVDDLFVAYPLWVDPAKGARLRALAEQAALTLGVDSVESARAMAAQLPGARALVEVDSGQHRSGVPAGEAGALAEAAAHSGLDVLGVFTFPGHSYAPGAQQSVAAQEATALREAAASLADHGVEPAVVSGGSTPSAADTDGSVLTEIRPGVYVFNDAQQWELGVVPPESVALTAVGTVVSHAGGHVLLDTGSKVLGADRAPYSSGHGRLLDHPDARITLLAEHHAVVAWPHDDLPERGTPMRVVPNHVCTAVNLVDELVVVRGGAVVDTWRVAARGANT